MNPDSVQHLNVKIFAEGGVDLESAIPVFHRWIRDGVCPELLIDVTDYCHVPAGPGILLVALEANYSLDNRGNRPGLLYNRKAALEGTLASRLEQAHRAALAACDRLEAEPEFAGKTRFNRSALEVSVNDRLLAPNTEETWLALKPVLEAHFPGFAVERTGEPRDLFRVFVTRS